MRNMFAMAATCSASKKRRPASASAANPLCARYKELGKTTQILCPERAWTAAVSAKDLVEKDEVKYKCDAARASFTSAVAHCQMIFLQPQLPTQLQKKSPCSTLRSGNCSKISFLRRILAFSCNCSQMTRSRSNVSPTVPDKASSQIWCTSCCNRGVLDLPRSTLRNRLTESPNAAMSSMCPSFSRPRLLQSMFLSLIVAPELSTR